MTKFWRLLMASTVLSGLAGLGSAHAGTIEGFRASPDVTEARIVLAQAFAQNDKNKKQNNNANPNRGNNNANQNPNRGNNNANQNPNRGNKNANQNPNRGNNNANQNPNRGNKNSNANDNRNKNANSGTTKPTSTNIPPPPPLTNTRNNNNKGNANNNNQGNNTGNKTTTTPPPINKVVRQGGNSLGDTGHTNATIASGGAGKGVTVKTSTGKTATNVNDIKAERTVVNDGNKTIIKEPDRTIVKDGNKTIIRNDETLRFKLGAVNVNVQKAGADNRTIILRPGGQKVVTLNDRNGFLLRRSIILPNGREIVLINNRPRAGNFFIVLPPPFIRIPRERYIVAYRDAPPALIYDTLMAPPVDRIDRAYSLDEIRYSPTLRDRMPRIDIDSVTFDSGSWELAPEQINKLGPIADAMKRGIEQNPQVVFLVEGYTDAVGDENDNLSLSDRRAEAVAVALTEQFGVPAENLSTQGYGEQDLKVPTDGPELANRRVTIRNIAPLLNGKVAQGGGQMSQ